jgi:hypothetical protein
MTEILLTYRPFKWTKPMSWINRITRKISSSPYDHVAISTNWLYIPKENRWIKVNYQIVYESLGGEGVREIDYRDWVKDREGTWLDCYEVPEHHINFDLYSLAYGKPYDYWDAISHAFNNYKAMEKRKYKRYTCSKLTGLLLMLDNWYKALPSDITKVCERRDYKLDKRLL